MKNCRNLKRKFSIVYKFSIIKTSLIAGLLLVGSAAYTQSGVNPWGNTYDPTPEINLDPNKPVNRGYIVPSTSEIPNGAKIRVEIYHQKMNDPVSLWLQVAVNDGKGNVQILPLKQLSDGEKTNPTNYKSVREFDVTYDELNRTLKSLFPNADLKIEPGTPLYVYARFDQAGHQWGGVARGGVISMPGRVTSRMASVSTAKSPRPTELDLAFPIQQSLANIYNDPRSKSGLKVGGQIRSRVEAEGKFQIPLEDFEKVRKELFQLSQDPAAARAVLGDDWTFKLEDRYMVRDASGQLVLDSNGLPTPDPMVDTYYDNATFDAAKNDEAIRYRWTEGNKTGSWNYKPGIKHASGNGVVYRIEYGLDATDDKPATIAKFADSDHPLNIFRSLNDLNAEAKASDYLHPSVKVVDYRYKFKMQHKSGLIVELSLDDVRAESLRAGQGTSPIRFIQMEMDIDHLATTSNNTSRATSQLMHQDVARSKAWREALGKNAFIDGRPVMHGVEDLEPTSSIRKQRKAEFDLAVDAITRIRKKVIGDNWLPAPQKYALAAHALKLSGNGQSPSVIELLTKSGHLKGAPNCKELFASLIRP
jgi:hypothetical protein